MTEQMVQSMQPCRDRQEAIRAMVRSRERVGFMVILKGVFLGNKIA